MEFSENKLKVIWICYFLDQTIKTKLGIDEKEVGPWISLGIEEIKKRNDIELHLIIPMYRILRNLNYTERNVHYHFLKVGIPFTRTSWPDFLKLDVWSNYCFFNCKVKKLVKRINPDLVNLYGAENAFYSSSVLGIKGYPILVTIQGFITLSKLTDSKTPEIRKRIQIEKRILGELKYFAIQASFIEKYIRSFNPCARIYRYHTLYTKTNVKIDVRKEYDLVFFARLSKQKGIEDLIKAVFIAKDQKHDIKLCIIGGPDVESYIHYIKHLIEELNLTHNIIFKGFIPTQEEMHNEVIKAKISVLPTYNDTMPGTIIESMLLGIPVISYNVGGIPDLNKDEEHVILVEPGNIKKLAFKIIELLKDVYRQKELAEKGRVYARLEFDNSNSMNQLVQVYLNVIKEFKNKN
jgi:glycosyltransferase involved in cell wall biosynthesis